MPTTDVRISGGDARYAEIDAGHGAPVEDPAAFVARIVGFLDEGGRRRRPESVGVQEGVEVQVGVGVQVGVEVQESEGAQGSAGAGEGLIPLVRGAPRTP